MRSFSLAILLVLLPGIAYAAYPTVAALQTTSLTAGTSHVVDLPACASGDTLLLFSDWDNDPGVRTWPSTSSTDTQLLSSTTRTGVTLEVRYRFADGTEPASLTVSIVNSQRSAHHVYCITGAHGSTPPEVGSATNDFTETPNPPTLTASWGAEDNLWFAATAVGTGRTINTYPTDYSSGSQTDNGAGSNSGLIATARRELTSATDNPGTFSFTTAGNWAAQTLVVRPSVVPAGTCRGGMLLRGAGC